MGHLAHLWCMTSHPDLQGQIELAHLSIPVALITVGELGAMTATLDGEPFPPPGESRRWTRSQFGDLLDAFTQQRKRTIRLEVRESDGSVFTEIIHAGRGATEATDAATQPATRPDSRRARRGRPPRLIEITADGFIQGEDILVAIPVSTAEGDSSGVARAVIDLDHLGSQAHEVAFIGYVSGRIVTERLR